MDAAQDVRKDGTNELDNTSTYCIDILRQMIFACVECSVDRMDHLTSATLMRNFTEPERNATLWLVIEDAIRIYASLNDLRSEDHFTLIPVLLELQKRLMVSSTKIPLVEKVSSAPGDLISVCCSTIVGSSGYVTGPAISPKTMMTHIQALICVIVGKLTSPLPLSTDGRKALQNIFRNSWECSIMFDRAKGAIYPMPPAKRQAVKAAVRSYVQRSLQKVGEDLTLWTYLLSGTFSVLGGQVLRPQGAEGNSPGSASDPNTSYTVGPVCGLKSVKFSVELPLRSESCPDNRLLQLVSGIPEELYAAMDTITTLLPSLIKSTHDCQSSADEEMSYLIILLTEFCSFVGPHKNLVRALELLNLELGATSNTNVLQSQLKRLVELFPKFEDTLDVIYGAMVFVFRWLGERLYLWTSETHGMSFSPVNQSTLPVTTASFYMLPVSLNHLKTKNNGPIFSPAQQRTLAFKLFKEGESSTDCQKISSCLYQVLVLSLNIAVSNVAEPVRQELCSLLQTISQGAQMGVAGYASLHFNNLAGSVITPIHPINDYELFQAIACCPKYFIEHAGLVLAIEQRLNTWNCLHSTFTNCRPGNIALTHCEFFFAPVAQCLRLWWFGRGLLSSLDIAAGSIKASQVAPLIAIERSLWDILLHGLKVGPIVARSDPSWNKTSVRKNAFSIYDIYLAFFGFVEAFLKHVNRHVTQHLAAEAGTKDFNGAATKIHGLVCLQQNAWIDLFIKWCKAGQHIAGQQSSGTGQWTECELGMKIRESAIFLYHLFKGLKNAMPEDAKTMWLSKEVLQVMQGNLVGSNSGSVTEASLEHSQVSTKGKVIDMLKQEKVKPELLGSSDSHSVLPAANPSGVKRVRETRDLAKEMMSQWKANEKLSAPNSSGGSLKINDDSKDKSWRRTILLNKLGPTTAADSSSAPGTGTRETMIVGPGGKPIVQPSSENKEEGPPKLKKISLEEKKQLAVEARAGLQKVLMEILEWDVFNLENYQPPELQDFPSRLPISFASKQVFQKYFGPLVLEECRCSMLQERMERRLESFPLIISSASLSAGWMLIGARSAKLRAPRDGSTRPPPATESVIESASPYDLEALPFRKHDLLLLIPCDDLRNPTSPFEGRTLNELLDENGGGSPKYPHFLGVLEKREEESLLNQSSMPSTVRDQVQCHLRLPRSAAGGSASPLRIQSSDVAIGSKWIAYSLASLTTSVREFQSLFMSSFSPLFDFILHPTTYLKQTSRPIQKRNRAQGAGPNSAPPAPAALSTLAKPPLSFLESLKSRANLNQSQALAVKHALTADFGIALLQGPPGTGKTKTLLSILSAIFLQRMSEKQDSKSDESRPRKILVCAPSNAAVDEVACRVLREGLVGSHGQIFHPKCFRIGNPSRITRDAVREISLEAFLAKEDTDVKADRKSAMEKGIEKIAVDLQKIEQQLLTLQAEGVGGAAYAELKTQQRALFAQRKKLRDSLSDDVKGAQRSRRDHVIKSADIFFATLSGSASELLSGLTNSAAGLSTGGFFEYVIIDEAAQAVELSTLIPLRHDIEKLVLIGDPQQLPATVLSNSAKKYNYERSLFQRLEANGVEVVMLNVQYRMRKEISAFPSKHFYKSMLIDDPLSVLRRPETAWSTSCPALLGPFKFFHLTSQEDRAHSQSLYNTTEATFVVELILFLLKRSGRRKGTQVGVQLKDVAVLTPYRQQVLEIQRLLRAKNMILAQYEKGETDLITAEQQIDIDVCTIDSFQGREKSIILFSCVRSLATGNEAESSTPAMPSTTAESSNDDEFGAFFGRPQKRTRPQTSAGQVNIGFVADIRRLNVAITRARESLWIVGNAHTLSNHETWRALITHAKQVSLDIRQTTTSQPAAPWATPQTDDIMEQLSKSCFIDVPAVCQALRKGTMSLPSNFFSLCETRLR